MKYFRKLTAYLLCAALCVLFIGNDMSAQAANENNTQDVIFSVELDDEQISVSDLAQTVVMRLIASKDITVDGIGFQVTRDDESPLTIASITGGEGIGAFPAASTNLETGVAGWSSDNYEDVSNVRELAIITFTVPANTPAGTYNVGIEKLELTSNYGDIWENAATASTTLTITDAGEAATGYTAGISAVDNPVNKGDKVSLNVAVNHNAAEGEAAETGFNAGEIVLNYDSNKLSFVQTESVLGNATVNAETAGKLKLADYGADKSFGSTVYTMVFDTIGDGSTTVELKSAAFINKEDAKSDDLKNAKIEQAKVVLTINAAEYTVTLPEGFSGDSAVERGEAYDFEAVNKNYDYTFTATAGENPVTVTDNGDGTYTVDSVTGDLVITIASQTGKSRSVTFDGAGKDDVTDAAATATYGTDYIFELPTEDGYIYALGGITIGGSVYTGYEVADDQITYTIPGEDLIGDVVITVTKEEVPDNSVSVTVNGNGAGVADGYANIAVKNESYTLTITPEAGYNYEVTAKMGGMDVTEDLIVDGNSYQIATVTGNLVFTIERTVITDGVSVDEYVTLDGTIMWLIKNDTEVDDGKVPTYDGANMFWSEKYEAYCYLVVAESLSLDDAKALVGIQTGSVVSVNYGMDVNMSGKVDASDAQLVYNIYQASYQGFDTVVTMEKFLRADVNGSAVINVEDATAIIDSILGTSSN